MRTRLHLAALLPLCASVLVAAPAHAVGGKDAAAAEALFQQGRAAADKGDWETACTKLRESQRLDPAVGTAFNVGNCEEKLGHLAAAWALFVDVAKNTKAGDERHTIAQTRADGLEKRIPKLTVRLGEGAPEGTTVRRDDTELTSASLGAPLRVDPGKHTITVTAPGHKTRTRNVELAEGDRRDIDVLPGAEGAGAESAAPAEAPSDPGSTQRTAGWVIGGVGAASLLVSAITGGLTLAKKGTVDANCTTSNKACNQQGFDAANAGRTLGKVNLATFIIGLAAAGGGVALILTGGSGDASKAEEKKPDTSLLPSFGPTGAELTLIHRF